MAQVAHSLRKAMGLYASKLHERRMNGNRGRKHGDNRKAA